MHIRDIFENNPTTFSFEFFPPKTSEAAELLYQSIRKLESLKPAFVSVTYGAGGSTREMTHEVVVRLKRTTTLDPVAHLTSVCHSESDIRHILERYAGAGISNILALAGDPPVSLPDHDRRRDAFRYACDLVQYICSFNQEGRHPDPRGFGVGVAGFPEGHPGTPNRVLEMEYLKQKVDAGADYICTQMFFDNNDFYDFRQRCELAGIDRPIIAGIMPILSLASMKRIPQMALGMRYPARLLRKLLKYQDDESIRKIGIDWATQQCHDLLDNQVRGIHFYTLNRAMATVEIYRRLGASNSSELADLTR